MCKPAHSRRSGWYTAYSGPHPADHYAQEIGADHPPR